MKKSIRNRIWSEKRDYLKNSTAPTREHHFWRFNVLKILPKLITNGPKTTPKSDWNFDRIVNRFLIDFGSILAPKIGPKWLQKWSKKRTQKSKEISSNKLPKMAPKLEPRGGQTNQLFAHWTLLGDTLPPKGTPQCPRGGPGRPNGGQGAPKWSQNGAKIEPKGSQMERTWSSKRAKIDKTISDK